MGNRLSSPKGVDGMSEAPRSIPSPSPAAGSLPPKRAINPRLLMAPIAAFTMAGLVFLYTRSSIRAAKLDVQQRRAEGGGQIDWGRESQRNHGQIDKINTAAINKEAIFSPGKAARGEVKKTDADT